MITTETNQPYPNRIQIQCNDFAGPWISDRLGLFNPIRDMRIYVDGDVLTVQAFSFDGANNRYLIYSSAPIDLAGTVQVCYHIPDPPFYSVSGVAPPTPSNETLNPTVAYNDGPGIVDYSSSISASAYYLPQASAALTPSQPIFANDVIAFNVMAIARTSWVSTGYPYGFSGSGTNASTVSCTPLMGYYGSQIPGFEIGYTCFAYAWIASSNASDTLSITGITDSLGNNWVPLSNQFNYKDAPRWGTNPLCARLFWCTNAYFVSNAGSFTVTATFSGCTGTAHSGVSFAFVQNTLSLITTLNTPQIGVNDLSCGPLTTTATRGTFVLSWAGPTTYTNTSPPPNTFSYLNSSASNIAIFLYGLYVDESVEFLAPPSEYMFGPAPVPSGGATNGFAFMATFNLPTAIPTLPNTVNDNLGNTYTILSGSTISGTDAPEPYCGAVYTSTGATGTVNGLTTGGTATITVTPAFPCNISYSLTHLRGLSTTLAAYNSQNTSGYPAGTINSGTITTSGSLCCFRSVWNPLYTTTDFLKPTTVSSELSTPVQSVVTNTALNAWIPGILSAGTFSSTWAVVFDAGSTTEGAFNQFTDHKDAIGSTIIALTPLGTNVADIQWNGVTNVTTPSSPAVYASVSTPVTQVNGEMTGVTFSGTASVLTPISQSYSNQPSLTVEFWFVVPTTGYSGLMMVNYGSYGSASPVMGIHVNSSGHIAFQQEGTDVVTTASAYNDGLLHQCVLTIAPNASVSAFTLYIDGASAGTANTAFTALSVGSPPTPYYWSFGPLAGTSYVWLSHLAIWSQAALASSVVASHYNTFVNDGQLEYENAVQAGKESGQVLNLTCFNSAGFGSELLTNGGFETGSLSGWGERTAACRLLLRQFTQECMRRNNPPSPQAVLLRIRIARARATSSECAIGCICRRVKSDTWLRGSVLHFFHTK